MEQSPVAAGREMDGAALGFKCADGAVEEPAEDLVRVKDADNSLDLALEGGDLPL